MGFLAGIVRFLFWVILLTWSMRLLGRLFTWILRGTVAAPPENHSAAESGTTNSAAGARRLVRDPVCGVHVAEVLAIPLREGAEVQHFCSVACRDQYVGSRKKIAANG